MGSIMFVIEGKGTCLSIAPIPGGVLPSKHCINIHKGWVANSRSCAGIAYLLAFSHRPGAFLRAFSVRYSVLWSSANLRFTGS